MGRAVRPWLFDPGWLYVIAGLAMCSAITLIPAQRDLVEIEGLLERLEMREARLGDRLGAHARFLEALDRGDDDLVVRLAAAQLNMVRAGEHPMLRTSVESASVTDWIETSLPPLPPPPAPEPVSMLAQLVEGPARLWLLGASVMTIFIGLLIGPARSRHEAFGSLLAVPDDEDDEGDGSDVDDAAAREIADTALPAEASEPVAADDPEPPVVVVRARRVQRFEDEPSALAVTIGDRVTGAMSRPISRPSRGVGDIVLRSEIHAPPVLIAAPASVIRSVLDREDEMHDEEMHEVPDEMQDETRTPRPAASLESKDAVAAEVDASDIGGEDPDYEEDEEYEYVDEDGEPVDEDDDEYEYEHVDEDGNPVDEDEDEEDDEESEPVDEEEEEYEYVDEDGNPVDEDEDEEDDEESEPVDEEEEEEEEYEYVDEDGNPVDEDEDEEDDEESEPVDEEEEEEEEYEYVDEDGNPVDEDDDEYEYVDEDGDPADEDDEEYEYELVSEDGEPVDGDDPAEKSD